MIYNRDVFMRPFLVGILLPLMAQFAGNRGIGDFEFAGNRGNCCFKLVVPPKVCKTIFY